MPTSRPGLRNGRWWSATTADAKILYIAGLLDYDSIFPKVLMSAVKEARRQGENDPIDMRVDTNRLAVGDFAKSIDEFYNNSANARIPVGFAYDYSRDKLYLHKPQDWLTKYELRLRKGASQMH